MLFNRSTRSTGCYRFHWAWRTHRAGGPQGRSWRQWRYGIKWTSWKSRTSRTARQQRVSRVGRCSGLSGTARSNGSHRPARLSCCILSWCDAELDIAFEFYARHHICYSTYMLLPIRPSVTRVDHTKTVKVRIMIFSPYGSPIPLVFREQVSSRNSEVFPQSGSVKWGKEGGVAKIGNFRPLSRLRNGARYDKSCYWSLIAMCTRAFHWYQNQWPWVAPDPGFKVTMCKISDFRPLNCQYLKNGWS